jgi:hypothetical protein
MFRAVSNAASASGKLPASSAMSAWLFQPSASHVFGGNEANGLGARNSSSRRRASSSRMSRTERGRRSGSQSTHACSKSPSGAGRRWPSRPIGSAQRRRGPRVSSYGRPLQNSSYRQNSERKNIAGGCRLVRHRPTFPARGTGSLYPSRRWVMPKSVTRTVPLGVNRDVFRGEPAVCESSAVSVLQGMANLDCYVELGAERAELPASEPLPQGSAFDVLDDEHGNLANPVACEAIGNVWMQSALCPPLAGLDQLFAERFVSCEVLSRDLQDNRQIPLHVAREIHPETGVRCKHALDLVTLAGEIPRVPPALWFWVPARVRFDVLANGKRGLRGVAQRLLARESRRTPKKGPLRRLVGLWRCWR